ncbi:SurA N-terminal domain-containing protein [Ornithinibacillus salinisoli]|uniref:SurA N-terminal domain-containing protein n=1 Tax=Ornithinibacillus salinisoli TaxID=1848459 RepID=A0ABW4VXD0_9BACI
MKKLIMLMLAVGLATFLVACGDDKDTEEETEGKDQKTDEQAGQEVDVTEDEKVAEDEVVATINGTEVTGDQYNPVYLQTKLNAANYGMDVSDQEALKEQTINELIAQELIKQEAEDKGVEVTDEEVQNELDVYKEENGDEFSAYLEQVQITEDEFKDQIGFTLMLNKYMEQELQVDEISDEEIKDTYDQLKEENEDIMSFEEAKTVLKQNLTKQKQNELLQAKIDELKEQAEIETLI